MNISRYCQISDLNWEALTELSARLEKFKIVIDKINIDITLLPDKYTINSINQLLEFIKKQGIPKEYIIDISAKRNNNNITLRVLRSKNIHLQEFLLISISNVDGDEELNSIMKFLNLEAAKYMPKKIERTAFIAYRFDDIGETLALKLSRFLELLGLSVTTGRAYSPKKISEKVEERMRSQSVVFVILTKGEDNTWLTQEPTLAKTMKKPIFLLKDNEYNYTAGIFADQEFIPFHSQNFEKSFIPILEGLRELKLLTS